MDIDLQMDWVPLLVGGLIGVALQAIFQFLGFSAKSVASWVAALLRRDVKCHLGWYDYIRLDDDSVVARAKVYIYRSVLKRGVRFSFDLSTPAVPVVHGDAIFSGSHLVLAAKYKGDPYMAVFHAKGDRLDSWKLGVFSGVRLFDSSPYAGAAILVKKSENPLTDEEARELLSGGSVVAVTGEILTEFVGRLNRKYPKKA